ncbi:uncharacterized protein MYCFIDRAFT_175211 [Pseudocercospora fijiensis CIRAD86]|uniref:Uncharacterized protein n=1 Tax=Pseudocercospora fijiensis (strain CIRAD86) TaxID=383855 RepID=M3AWZ1_PSEFD|nr:uncharacterized protein MYCFIDRAFT_175211 [Pseudocercospora fijiensis CIRAD86]EME81618.1 hypothetical protein MYCFIDRAFT_175211 [Pseudocercospora fijiensis CIRAD86]
MYDMSWLILYVRTRHRPLEFMKCGVGSSADVRTQSTFQYHPIAPTGMQLMQPLTDLSLSARHERDMMAGRGTYQIPLLALPSSPLLAMYQPTAEVHERLSRPRDLRLTMHTPHDRFSSLIVSLDHRSPTNKLRSGSLEMGLRGSSEKSRPGRMRSRTSTLGRGSIVVCQNVLLWMSLYVAASTAYILILGVVSRARYGGTRLMSFAEHAVLILPLLSEHYHPSQSSVDAFQGLATHTLRLLVTIWMIACGLTITFTAARTPLCASSSVSPLDKGKTCIINRRCKYSAQRFDMTLTNDDSIVSGALFVLLHKVNEPYRCHLFGIVKEHKLLPMFLPYKQKKCHATFSEMSFKCRSSTSLSSRQQPPDQSTVPTPNQPHGHGLGIHTGRSSAPPSLLRPRPSLSSIRSHTSLYLPPPPSSPLPPLPAYIPPKHQTPPPSIHRAIHPPKRPYRPGDSVRILRPAPAHLDRTESFSSVYSRSTSGESRRSVDLPCSRTTSSRSTSTSTLKPSPLGIMTLAESPEVVSLRRTGLVEARRRRRSFSSSTTKMMENDAAAVGGRMGTLSDSSLAKPWDSRLKGYVESQNRIRELSRPVEIQPVLGNGYERKDRTGRIVNYDSTFFFRCFVGRGESASSFLGSTLKC